MQTSIKECKPAGRQTSIKAGKQQAIQSEYQTNRRTLWQMNESECAWGKKQELNLVGPYDQLHNEKLMCIFQCQTHSQKSITHTKENSTN